MELQSGDTLAAKVIEYEPGKKGDDDFVIIRSNGTHREPVVNDAYNVDALLIINTNRAILNITIPGKSY